MNDDPKDRKNYRRENIENRKQKKESSDEIKWNKQNSRFIKNRKQEMTEEELWEDWEDEIYRRN